jgi:hypothetical protein
MAGRQRLERLQQLGEGGYLFAGYGKCGWLDRDGFRFRVSLSFPWCFQNCPLLFYVLKTLIYRQKYCQVPKLGPSTSLFFFCKFDFSYFFGFLLSTSTRMRKIIDFKNNTLKVKRVLKTLENLNSFETMLKMLKMIQIY